MLNKIDHSVAASDNLIHSCISMSNAVDSYGDVLRGVVSVVGFFCEISDFILDDVRYVNDYLQSAHAYLEGLTNHAVAILENIDMHDVNVLKEFKPICLDYIRKILEDRHGKLKDLSMRFFEITSSGKCGMRLYIGSSDLSRQVKEMFANYSGLLQSINNLVMCFPDLSNIWNYIELSKDSRVVVPVGVGLEYVSRKHCESFFSVLNMFETAYSRKSKREEEKNNHDKILAAEFVQARKIKVKMCRMVKNMIKIIEACSSTEGCINPMLAAHQEEVVSIFKRMIYVLKCYHDLSHQVMSQHAMQIYEANSRDTKPSPEAAFTLGLKALLIQDRIFLNNVADLNRNLKNVVDMFRGVEENLEVFEHAYTEPYRYLLASDSVQGKGAQDEGAVRRSGEMLISQQKQCLAKITSDTHLGMTIKSFIDEVLNMAVARVRCYVRPTEANSSNLSSV